MQKTVASLVILFIAESPAFVVFRAGEAAGALHRLPLRFEENRGQAETRQHDLGFDPSAVQECGALHGLRRR